LPEDWIAGRYALKSNGAAKLMLENYLTAASNQKLCFLNKINYFC
jgi:hypothetical protein